MHDLADDRGSLQPQAACNPSQRQMQGRGSSPPVVRSRKEGARAGPLEVDVRKTWTLLYLGGGGTRQIAEATLPELSVE